MLSTCEKNKTYMHIYKHAFAVWWRRVGAMSIVCISRADEIFVVAPLRAMGMVLLTWKKPSCLFFITLVGQKRTMSQILAHDLFNLNSATSSGKTIHQQHLPIYVQARIFRFLSLKATLHLRVPSQIRVRQNTVQR